MSRASDAGRVFTARPASVSPWVVAAVAIATLVAVPVATVLSSTVIEPATAREAMGALRSESRRH